MSRRKPLPLFVRDFVRWRPQRKQKFLEQNFVQSLVFFFFCRIDREEERKKERKKKARNRCGWFIKSQPHAVFFSPVFFLSRFFFGEIKVFIRAHRLFLIPFYIFPYLSPFFHYIALRYYIFYIWEKPVEAKGVKRCLELHKRPVRFSSCAPTLFFFFFFRARCCCCGKRVRHYYYPWAPQ